MRSTLGLLVVSGALMLGTSSAATADSEFAVKNKYNGPVTGIRGTQNIRTDPATHTNETYVHLFQVHASDGVNFIGIGSANGMGVNNCPSQYNSGWDVYTDGRIGGTYFCNTEDVNRYSAGAQPYVSIQRVQCGSPGSPQGWRTKMSGIAWACYQTGWSTAGSIGAGLEHVGITSTYQTDRNIDVKNQDMEYMDSGVWFDWGTGQTRRDNEYVVDTVNDRQFNTYLGQLD